MSNGIGRKNYRRAVAEGSIRLGWSQIPSDILIELGGLFSEWGYVETQVDALLSSVLEKPAVGMALRSVVQSSRQRRTLLSELIGVTAPEDLKTQIAVALGNYNRLAEERGLYAHGVWGTHDGYPNAAIVSIDRSVQRVLHPDVGAVARGELSNFDRVLRDGSAVVTVNDLKRFRTALKKTSGMMAAVSFELQHRSSTAEIRATLGRVSSPEE